jgi:transcriptional regulator GlxA family with amidase domain
MDRRIQVVISAMESRISYQWNEDELAQLVNLSTSRFRHLFKTNIGLTAAQYLKSIRMQKAELLLRTSFLSIKEIVNQIGMTSGSHFGREFKKLHGAPPRQYRTSIQRKSSW